MQAPRGYGLLDLEVVQGSTFLWRIQLRDPKGQVVPLAGGAPRMQARKKVDDPDPPLFDLTPANGGATITIDDKIIIFISDEETAALDFVTGVYDIEFADSLGNVRRVMAGKIQLVKEVTR